MLWFYRKQKRTMTLDELKQAINDKKDIWRIDYNGRAEPRRVRPIAYANTGLTIFVAILDVENDALTVSNELITLWLHRDEAVIEGHKQKQIMYDLLHNAHKALLDTYIGTSDV